MIYIINQTQFKITLLLICLKLQKYFITNNKEMETLNNILNSALSSDSSTKNLLNYPSETNKLLQILKNSRQDNLYQFANYLQNQCDIRPTSIMKVINQLFTNSQANNYFGEGILKIRLLFNLYSALDILRLSKEDTNTRKKIQKVFRIFIFSGSNLKKLIKECFKVAEIPQDSIQQMIKEVADDHADQINLLFNKEEVAIEVNNNNYDKNSEEKLTDLIADYLQFPQNSFQKYLQKELIHAHVLKNPELREIFIKKNPQFKNFKSQIDQFKEIYQKLNAGCFLPTQIHEILKKIKEGKEKDMDLNDYLSLLKSKIMPINVFELERLIDKTKNAQKCILGKDVILFIGNTGSGKSTTILKFLGYTLKKGKFKQLSTLIPIETLQEQHKTFYTSPQSKSCTRYINAVPVPNKMYEKGTSQSKKTLVICDSPGFGDSAGVEVDIANGIGMINALYGARSVKIIVILPYDSLTADRMAGVVKISQVVSNLFHQLNVLGSIKILFNRSPLQKIQQIPRMIQSKLNHLNQTQRANQKLMVFLSQIMEQSKDGSNFIDPFQTNFTTIFNNIYQMNPITEVKNKFQYQFSPSTKRQIEKYAQSQKSKVKDHLNSENMNEAQFHLSILLKLKNILLNNYKIKDYYQQLTKYIQDMSQKQFANYETLIKQLINDQKSSKYEMKLKKSQQKLKEFYQRFRQFQNISVVSQQRVDLIVQQCKQKLSSSCQDVILITPETINAILAFSKVFGEELKKKVRNDLTKKYDKTIQQIQRGLKQKKIIEMKPNIEKINVLLKSIKQIQGKKSLQTSGQKQKLIKIRLKKELQSAFAQVQSFENGQKHRITQKSIEMVKSKIKLIKQIQQLKFLDKNSQIQSRLEEQIKVIQSKCKKRIFQLQTLKLSFQNEGDNTVFEKDQFVKKKIQIELLMQIEDLQQKLKEDYDHFLQKIGIKHKENFQILRGYIQTLKEHKNNQIYKKLDSIRISTVIFLNCCKILGQPQSQILTNQLQQQFVIFLKGQFKLIDSLSVRLSQISEESLIQIEHMNNKFIAYSKMGILWEKVTKISEDLINQMKIKLRIPYQQYLQSFLSLVKQNFHYQYFYYNLQKLQQFSFFAIRIEQIIDLKGQDFAEQEQKLHKQLQTICTSIKDDAILFIKSQLDLMYQPCYLLQLVKILLSINQKPSACKFLSKKIFFQPKQHISNIENKLRFVKDRLQQKLKSSQKIVTDLENLLTICTLYVQVEDKYRTKTEESPSKFGFYELRKKYQQKLYRLLKNDQDKVNKMIIGFKASQINFKQLKQFFDRFSLIKNEVGTNKKMLIINQLTKIQLRVIEDLRRLNLQIVADSIYRINDSLQIFKQAACLERQLNLLYTTVEDKKNIRIQKSDIKRTGNQIIGYYRQQINELMKLLKQLNYIKVNQKLKTFGPFQARFIQAFNLQQSTKLEKKPQQLQKLDQFIEEKLILLKQDIQSHNSINQLEKKQIQRSKRIKQLVSILNAGISKQVISKYHDESTDYPIDDGFRKYYQSTNEQNQRILEHNAQNYLTHMFNSYKERYNSSKDQTQKIQKVITQAIKNLPNNMKQQYKKSFLEIKKELNDKSQGQIHQKIQKLKKDPKNINEFIKQVKKSFQNNHKQYHSNCISKFNSAFSELQQRFQQNLQQKLKFLQVYLIKLYKQNKQYLQKDIEILQILRRTFSRQVKLLKDDNIRMFTEIKQFFKVSSYKKNKVDSYRQQVINLFKIYHFFISVGDNQLSLDTKKFKLDFITLFEENLNQFINTYNANIDKKPQCKLDSDQALDSQKNQQIKTYIEGLKQSGYIIAEIQRQVQQAQIVQKKYNKNNLLSAKIAKIKQYDPLIQSYQDQFQEVRIFLKNFDFYGDIKRNMSPKQLQQDLQKLNRLYKILQEKQFYFVDLFSQKNRNNTFVFSKIQRQISQKFDGFVEEALQQVKQTFRNLQGQSGFKVNLLICQLEIMKKKKGQYSFIQREKVNNKYQQVKNKIKQEFQQSLRRCKEIFQDSYNKFKEIKNQIEQINKKHTEKIKELHKQMNQTLQIKLKTVKQKVQEQINNQKDKNKQEKLRMKLNVELNSIQKQVNDQKSAKMADLQKQYKPQKEKLMSIVENKAGDFGNSLMINQKALIDIIYNFGNYKESFQKIVEDIKKSGPQFVKVVQKNLIQSEDPRSIGKVILSNHKTFANYSLDIINKLIKGQDINYVIKNLQRIEIGGRKKMTQNQLKSLYNNFKIFQNKYQQYKRKYKNEPNQTTINYIVNPLKSLGNQIKEEFYKRPNPIKSLQKKINLLAGIFALWAIMKAQKQQISKTVQFTIEPHPTQITTLLLLLGISQPDQKIFNRLAQVGTGEGKSIVLAGLCSYLALVGFKVRCACYSVYLSGRDQESFKELFQRLGIENNIKYGTFNQLCEDILNGGGKNLKKEIQSMVLGQGNFDLLSQAIRSKFAPKKKDEDRTILVIDEVDVFFEDSFFGKTYCPAICLKGEEVAKLLNYVWNMVHNNDKSSPQQIILSQDFKNLVTKYPTLKLLLQNQVHGMVAGAKNYKHDYHIDEKKIVYKDGDAISHKINYGYKTVFANLFQFNNGRVSKPNLDQALQISLMVAQFSYAELPSYFQNILGVTGTLEVLPKFKKVLLDGRYKIKDQYAIPSAFGINKKRIEIYNIAPQGSHYQKVIAKIDQIKNNRPIIIFFKGPNQLNQFANSKLYQPYMRRTYNLTECHDASTRNSRILTAVNPNNITLMSSAFGRGTDFVMLDDKVKQNGGLHIIHAFISLDQSQEIQIKGRTARQNSKGSYDCVLSQNWLEQLDLQINQIGKDFSSQQVHQVLWKARENKTAKLSESTMKMLEDADNKHKKVFKIFTQSKLSQKDLVEYVSQLNNYPLLKRYVIKTILCLDATGSMSNALKRTCQIIGAAFQRSYAVLAKQKVEATIQVKIKVYRNYNCPHNQILEGTAFQNTSINLKSFLQTVRPKGGLGNQALQVLFQSLNKEDKISQVILIGDAAPNTVQEVSSKRANNHGESYWNQYGFPKTHIDKQIADFKKKNCPVHSFYLNNGNGFTDISSKTGGTASPFQINSSKVTEELAGFIVQNILKITEKETGNVNLVETYRRMYMS